MKKFKVVVTDKRHTSYAIEREVLAKCNAELIISEAVSEEDVIRACKDADGILLDMAPMSEYVIGNLDRCKVISRYGVGFDNVDVDACTEKGIYFANVPDYCEEDVSDHALALLFTCIRQISSRDRRIRNGEWNISYPNSFRIKGKSLSVLGFGRIARSLVRKLSGFGLANIYAYDPYIEESVINQLGAKKVDLETAVKEADYLSLHMPVTEETKKMVDADFISMMKPTSILINTARGMLIDDAALIEALRNNGIAFAGLDTHNQEPLAENSEFLTLDNCVLTDHSAYNTQEAVVELKTKAAQNIQNVLEGKKPKYLINRI